MEWEEYITLFNDKYHNDVVTSAKAKEFSKLLQRNMTVIDYALKFDRLAKFVGDPVPTNGTRRERFLQGIQPMIARDVRITTLLGLTTYAQAVEKALTTESVENKNWRDNAARRDSRRP